MQSSLRETVKLVVAQPVRRWTLEIQDEERAQRIMLTDRPIVIGSSPNAELRVADRTVSAIHCEVGLSSDGVMIRDLGSTNGTFIGGTRIIEGRGGPNMPITIGQSTMVCLPDASEESEDEPTVEPLPGMVGSSTLMQKLARDVRKLAKENAPVLIVGESGTGKELVARALHTEGARRNGPMVSLNITAVPRELIESVLFGHERGAFTGALNRRDGAFVEADGGTLFFDEIGDLSMEAQPKLLRALDGYEVRRVGEAGTGRRPNARIVAATHVDLEAAVENGRFRRDLYHRLQIFVIELPPLRERLGDLAARARAMLTRRASVIGPREITPSGLAVMAAHPWPGNIRELDGVLQRASSYSRGRWIEGWAIERALCGRRSRDTMSQAEAKKHLARHKDNVSAAARSAGLPRTTFRKILSGDLSPR